MSPRSEKHSKGKGTYPDGQASGQRHGCESDEPPKPPAGCFFCWFFHVKKRCDMFLHVFFNKREKPLFFGGSQKFPLFSFGGRGGNKSDYHDLIPIN